MTTEGLKAIASALGVSIPTVERILSGAATPHEAMLVPCIRLLMKEVNLQAARIAELEKALALYVTQHGAAFRNFNDTDNGECDCPCCVPARAALTSGKGGP